MTPPTDLAVRIADEIRPHISIAHGDLGAVRRIIDRKATALLSAHATEGGK